MDQPPKAGRWIPTLIRVLLFCLGSAIILAGTSRLGQNLPKAWSDEFTAVLAIILTFSLTWLFVRWEGLDLADVGLIPNKQSTFRIAAGFGLGILLAILQVAGVMLSGHVKLVLFPGLSIAQILSASLLYFLLACREELAFRAYPLRGLNYVIGSWPAQLIVAVIFSLEHVAGGMSGMQAVLGSGVGAILFGMAALWTKGIALPIGMHFAWNFGQWVFGFKGVPGVWEVIIEKDYAPAVEQTGMISYLTVMGLAIGLFYFTLWPERKNRLP